MREVFLQKILADRNSKENVLVYADWLVENGNPLGEFIQVQVLLEDEDVDPTRRKELVDTESKLLEQNEKAWSQGISELKAKWEHLNDPKLTFRWGLPSRLTFAYLSEEDVSKIAETSVPQFLESFVVTLSMDSVYDESELEYGSVISALVPLAEIPFPCLKGFQLGDVDFEAEYYNCEVSGFGLLDFLKANSQIEDLRIAASNANAPRIFELNLPRLRVLHLMHEHNYPIETLAANSGFANLEDLSVLPHALEYGDEPYLDIDDLKSICDSPHLKNLRTLRLRLTAMGDEAAAVIVGSELLDHLHVLDLQGGNMTSDGVRTLLADERIKNLQFLNLSRNTIDGSGVQSLAESNVPFTAQDQHNGDMEEAAWLYEGDIE